MKCAAYQTIIISLCKCVQECTACAIYRFILSTKHRTQNLTTQFYVELNFIRSKKINKKKNCSRPFLFWAMCTVILTFALSHRCCTIYAQKRNSSSLFCLFIFILVLCICTTRIVCTMYGDVVCNIKYIRYIFSIHPGINVFASDDCCSTAYLFYVYAVFLFASVQLDAAIIIVNARSFE